MQNQYHSTLRALCAICASMISAELGGQTDGLACPVVDTAQALAFDDQSAIDAPAQSERFYGQDAQHDGHQPSYTVSEGGQTVLDNVTGLTWTQTADTDGDGEIDADDKLGWQEAQDHAETLTLEGVSDWRRPSIKGYRGLRSARHGRDIAASQPLTDSAEKMAPPLGLEPRLTV